uniref:Uncharacterized protein n=1 Tax=Romanomermis culicivorax TaxID=13658 RepID=A0A915I3Z1_ROMCU
MSQLWKRQIPESSVEPVRLLYVSDNFLATEEHGDESELGCKSSDELDVDIVCFLLQNFFAASTIDFDLDKAFLEFSEEFLSTLRKFKPKIRILGYDCVAAYRPFYIDDAALHSQYKVWTTKHLRKIYRSMLLHTSKFTRVSTALSKGIKRSELAGIHSSYL